MENDRFVNDQEITIVAKEHTISNPRIEISSEPKDDVRPNGNGLVLTVYSGSKRSGVIIDLNESRETDQSTVEISKLKVTGTVELFTVLYKTNDADSDWETLVENEKMSQEKVVSFKPMRVGKVYIVIDEPVSSNANFTVDIFGCFKVHCK